MKLPIIIIIFGVILIVLGIFMIVAPKASIKEEVVVTPELINEVKKSGVRQLVFGALIAVVGLVILLLPPAA